MRPVGKKRERSVVRWERKCAKWRRWALSYTLAPWPVTLMIWAYPCVWPPCKVTHPEATSWYLSQIKDGWLVPEVPLECQTLDLQSIWQLNTGESQKHLEEPRTQRLKDFQGVPSAALISYWSWQYWADFKESGWAKYKSICLLLFFFAVSGFELRAYPLSHFTSLFLCWGVSR
jgi:hypothetical protein